MNLVLFTLAAVLSQTRTHHPGDDANADPLRGRWIVVFAEIDGKLDKRRKAATVLCKEGKIAITRQTGETEEYAYHLDPAKTLKEIDIFPSEAASGSGPLKGIYIMEEDHLSVCIDFSGRNRASEMTAASGSQRLLLVLKRDHRIFIKSSRKKAV